MRFAVLAGTACSLVATVALAADTSPNTAALERSIAAAKSICIKPADFGFTATGELGASAQPNIPKILEALVGIKVSGSLKADYSKGIPSKDRTAALNS